MRTRKPWCSVRGIAENVGGQRSAWSVHSHGVHVAARWAGRSRRGDLLVGTARGTAGQAMNYARLRAVDQAVEDALESAIQAR
jgi:hypothetical protein